MEASALRAPAGLSRSRIWVGASLLRLRSDEQLVALFRAGHEEAFRVIHDRYRQRLFAYTRQMLPRRQDAEDALQDVFVRAYAGLRANDRALALRAWLYRIAHNRCVDELRRPLCAPADVIELSGARRSVPSNIGDPLAEAEKRESLRRLIADVRRLPEQQRSALLMRELSGMSYADLAQALGVTVPAVKSLLVRARVGLVQATEARDTACSEIRDELVLAHDRGVRPNSRARRHMRDCPGCRCFRESIRGSSRELAALAPALGPVAWLAHVIGGGSTAAASGASSGAAAASGTGGVAATGGLLAAGAGHVATLLAAVVVTAGGAVEIQHSLATPSKPRTQQTSSVGSGGTSALTTDGTNAASLAPGGERGAAAAAVAAMPARASTVSRHPRGSASATAGGSGSLSGAPAGSATGAASTNFSSTSNATGTSGNAGQTSGTTGTSAGGMSASQTAAAATTSGPPTPGSGAGSSPAGDSSAGAVPTTPASESASSAASSGNAGAAP